MKEASDGTEQRLTQNFGGVGGSSLRGSAIRGRAMARIRGVETREAGWFTRLVYWFVQRQIGKITGRKALVEPIKITAHHPRLVKAVGQMEMGLDAARSVPLVLKSLASIKAATLVGCPF